MIRAELTCWWRAATDSGVKERDDVHQGRVYAMLLAIAGAALLSGCISVNAPDKPIVIELNMNITMDVVYKLSGDATRTVDTNKEIF